MVLRDSVRGNVALVVEMDINMTMHLNAARERLKTLLKKDPRQASANPPGTCHKIDVIIAHK